MESFIRYGSITSDPLYDCSRISDDMAYLHSSVYRIPWGICSATYGSIVLIFYLLLLQYAFQPKNYESASFKLIIAVAINEMICTLCGSIVTGFYLIYGVTFCSFPTLTALFGVLGMANWGTYAILCVVLVINRLMILARLKIYDFFFFGNRVYYIILFAIFYGIIVGYFPPVLFNSYNGMYLANPMIYPNSSHLYINPFRSFNNIVLPFSNLFLNIILTMLVIYQRSQTYASRTPGILNQTYFAICVTLCNVASSSFFSINVLFYVPPEVQKLSTVVYGITCGAPGVVFVLSNKSLRKFIFHKYCGNPTSFIGNRVIISARTSS